MGIFAFIITLQRELRVWGYNPQIRGLLCYNNYMHLIDILGYIAGVLVVISLLPQAIKATRTKLTRDISLTRYIIYSIGLILWIIYAFMIKNAPVAFMNSVGLILAMYILVLKLKYR